MKTFESGDAAATEAQAPVRFFDTWECFKSLVKTGIPEAQAEAFVTVVTHSKLLEDMAAFNALQPAKILEESGYSEAQAKLWVHIIKWWMRDVRGVEWED